MYLKSISISHKPSNGSGWAISNFDFRNINLIAGKNASGKTRLVKSIFDLVLLFSENKNKIKSHTEFEWILKLENLDKQEVIYEFSCKGELILKEKLTINDEILLIRDENGLGYIKYIELDKNVNFEVENNKIVLTSKRDKKQHPFLENIFEWARTVYFFKFGEQLGRDILVARKIEASTLDTRVSALEVDSISALKDDQMVMPKLEIGIMKFGDSFRNKIISDINSIGYQINDLGFMPYGDEKVDGFLAQAIYITENNSTDRILQPDISQGMFRVLSIIIQITFLEYSLNTHSTILIDDIGEGLDFDRATNLINFLIHKAESLKDKIQLIMTTNDRFVMNNVDLNYWTIIDKSSGRIEFYSPSTHPSTFEDFRDIGLNNFDFFSGEYYKNTEIFD